MVNEQSARGLTNGLHAATLLRRFIDTRHVYGEFIKKPEALAIHELLADQLVAAIKETSNPALEKFFERPHFENTADTSHLLMLITAMFTWLTDALGYKANEFEATRLFFEATSPSPIVASVGEQLVEVMVFDCRRPLDRAGAIYASRERAIFMLGQYWDFYKSLLQQHGSAPVSFSPHPLLRFIVNARARITDSLKMIGDASLAAALDEVLEIKFDQDTSIVWEEWAEPLLVHASEAYEEARLSGPSGSFDLTYAERLFLESGRIQLRLLDKQAKEEMAKVLQRAERTIARPQPKADKPPDSCFELIRRVEYALRDCVVSQARTKAGNGWPQEVASRLGSAADPAREKMLRKGVSDEGDLIYFTDLRDVHEAINRDFSTHSKQLGLRQKAYNGFMGPILKGRTEEAHNRPERLWPEIEQQRVRVACFDLLRAMEAARGAQGRRES